MSLLHVQILVSESRVYGKKWGRARVSEDDLRKQKEWEQEGWDSECGIATEKWFACEVLL